MSATEEASLTLASGSSEPDRSRVTGEAEARRGARGRDGLRDPGGAGGHRARFSRGCWARRTRVSRRADPLAARDHPAGEPGDPLGAHLLDRPRSSASKALARLGLSFALPQALLLIVFQALWLLLILHGDPARGPGRPAGSPWPSSPAMLAQQYGLAPAPGTSPASALQRAAPAALGCCTRSASPTLFVAGDHAIVPIVGALLAAFWISGSTCAASCGLRFSRGARAPYRRPPVSRLLRAARPAVELLRGRRASARPGGAGAVPLALGARPLRRRAGVHEPALLHRQERRADHLPVGRVADARRRDARRTMWSLLWLTTGIAVVIVAATVRHRSLAGPVLLRRPVRRGGHRHLHRPAGDRVPERAPGALRGPEGARLSARRNARRARFRWPGSRVALAVFVPALGDLRRGRRALPAPTS